ncbi:MAG: peptide ABC transporter substrate-binding protein [Vulcanimicrobiaceae bacterium]
MRATLARAAGFATLATLASACAPVPDAAHGASSHAWTKRDTVRIGFYEEPDTLNPVISQMSFSTDVFQLVYDGLIRFDDRGRPVPDLARELPTLANGGISKDGRTLTYHLMPTARWHDGVPVTARDVVFTWHQIMSASNDTPTRVGYDRIARIDTPDDHTVAIHLRAAYPPALYLFKNAAQGSILPEHLLRRYASLNRIAYNTAPIGSGPYVLERWQHGNEMRFHANHAYFRGVPKIERVVARFVPDQNTMLSQLRTHEIDLYYDLPPLQATQIRAMSGIVLRTTSTLKWEHLNFNTARPPLDERDVRLALCYAVDEDGIYRKIYRGFGRAAPTHFNPDYGWGDPALRHYPYDPSRANTLLERAGWHRDSSGQRRRNGVPLAFALTTVTGVKAREAIEVFLQSAWRSLGADVSIKNAPAATLFAPPGAGGLLQSGKTDVTLFTWANTTPDPDDETYIAPDRLPPRGQNDSFYRSASIARAQRAGLATYDVATRRRAYATIARELYANVPEYVLDWLPETMAANVDLRGVGPAPVGSDLWNIAEWSYR